MVQLLGEQRQFSYGEISTSFAGLVESPVRTGGLARLRNAVLSTSGSIVRRGGTRFLQMLGEETILGVTDFDDQVVVLTPTQFRFFFIDDQGVRELTAVPHRGFLAHLERKYFPVQRVGRALFMQGEAGFFRLIYTLPRVPRASSGRENLGSWVLENNTKNIVPDLVPYTQEVSINFHIPRFDNARGATYVIENFNFTLQGEDTSLSVRGRGVVFPPDSITFTFDEDISPNSFEIPNDSNSRINVTLGSTSITRDDLGPGEQPSFPYTYGLPRSVAPQTLTVTMSGIIGSMRLLMQNERNLGADYGYTGTVRARSDQEYLYATQGDLFRFEMRGGEITIRGSRSNRSAYQTEGRVRLVTLLTLRLFIVEVIDEVQGNEAARAPLLARTNTATEAAGMFTSALGSNWLSDTTKAGLDSNDFLNFFGQPSVRDWQTRNDAYPRWAQIIGFHQNRLFFARSDDHDENRISFSGIGQYMNFLSGKVTNDLSPFHLSLDPGEAITWVVSINNLFIGTSKNIYQIESGETGFTLDGVVIRKVSSTRSRFAGAVVIGSQTFFLGIEKFAIYTLFFSRELNTYITRNTTAHIQHYENTFEFITLGRHANNLVATTVYAGTTIPGPLFYASINSDSGALGWALWEMPRVGNTVWGGYVDTLYINNRLALLKQYGTNIVLEEYDTERFLDLETEATISRTEVTYNESLYTTLSLDDYPYSYLGVNGPLAYDVKGRINTTLSEGDYTDLGIPMTGTKTTTLGLPIDFNFTTLEPLVNLGGIHSHGSVVIYSYVRALIERTADLRLGGEMESWNMLYSSALGSHSGYYYYENPINANDLGQLRLTLHEITNTTVPYGRCEVSSLYYKFTSEDK